MPFTVDPSSTAAHLRHRALAVRVTARALQHLDVLDLAPYASTDTWVGPSQQLWHDTLHRDRAELLRASRELLTIAGRLERRADDIDRLGVDGTLPTPHVR